MAHTEAGPDVLAHITHRRAVLAWTRHLLGHPDGDLELCHALMRESLELFEAAGQSHVPLAVTARQFLELREEDLHDKPSETVSLEGPPHYPLPPLGGGGTYPIAEYPYPWHNAVALARAVPLDARSLYSLLGATSYHLGGQTAPSPAFLVLAFTTALRSLGLECRLIPTKLRVTRSDGGSVDLPDWELPPVVTQNGEVRGHVTVWCEEAARLVDPALLIGQSRLAPDAAEREIFRSPVVFPAPDLNALLGISPATHREGPTRLRVPPRLGGAPPWGD